MGRRDPVDHLGADLVAPFRLCSAASDCVGSCDRIVFRFSPCAAPACLRSSFIHVFPAGSSAAKRGDFRYMSVWLSTASIEVEIPAAETSR